MKVLRLESVDPAVNLATEEYLLQTAKPGEDILLLWRNANTIVVGRHQLTLREVNAEYVREQGITVIRRMTGGGAVYHDMGNVNFSFITAAGNAAKVTLELFTRPVAEALRGMGLNAQVSGRNDITVDGAKVSGNAQCMQHGRVLHHGTLLFDADLSVLGKALNVHPAKLSARGINSVRSRVTNILPCLPEPMSVESFMDCVQAALSGDTPEPLVLSDADREGIAALCESKYRTHEWNIGQAPAASVENARKFTGGLVEVHMDIVDGILTRCDFFGDFMSLRSAEEISAHLVGLPYEREAVAGMLRLLNLTPCFGAITADDLLECIFDLSSENEAN